MSSRVYAKTQRNIVSDFAGKKVHSPTPSDTFFFLGKNNFFGFCENISKFFCNEFSSKKISKFFFNEIDCKKFRKFLIVHFRRLKNFLLLIPLQKNSKMFYSQFDWKKFGNFFKKSEKNVLPKKEKGVTGEGKCTFFPAKSDTTFHCFDVLNNFFKKIPSCRFGLQAWAQECTFWIT